MSVLNTATLVLGQAAAEGNSLMSMLPMVLIAVVIFMMFRSQMKRQKESRNMLSALAKGDEIVTSGGLLGKVTKVTDSYITAEVAEIADKPVEIVFSKNAVTTVLPKGTIKAL